MSELDFDGLEIGTDDGAVDEAFAAAFRRADGTDTETTTEEATPDEESSAAAEGQPRDEQGRFTPEVTDLEGEVEEKEQEGEQEQESPAASTGDPLVDEFLAKYDGDIEKAVKAAAHQNALLGRQADEVGQLRQQLEELRQQVAAPQQRPPVVPITAEVVEELDSLAVSNPQAALTRVAQLGDPTGQLTERVMDVWFATNPRQASAFQASLIAQQTEARVRAELQPIAEREAQSAEERAFVEAWNAAAERAPDLNELAPTIKEVLDERPALAKTILSTTDAAERAELLLAAREIAAARSGVKSSEIRRIAEKQQADEAAAAKKAATLARPSAVGSQPGVADKELTEADRIKAGLLGAASTSILDGLTTA